MLNLQEYKSKKGNELITFTCDFCSNSVQRKKNTLWCYAKTKKLHKCRSCFEKDRSGKTIQCLHCNGQIYRQQHQIRKNKSKFCSQSCAAIYNNTHKTTGIRVSKLEKWIQNQLITIYPLLQFEFNKKTAINSELDIYIPELKLAFELNGIYHYEPIHGQELLNRIKNNDNRKFQACLENKIELCIIDTSTQKYFKQTSSCNFLKIITTIIDGKIGGLGGTRTHSVS